MRNVTNTRMKGIDIADNCEIDKSIKLDDIESLTIGQKTCIAEGVYIKAKTIQIGCGCVIDKNVQILNAQNIVIGDHSYIGPGVRIIGGSFSIGEYSKIHNNCYIYSKNYVNLGHLTWLGQGTVLDGTGGINAGHFLGVGINSALYSHIRHGDILEGCKYNNNRELCIGDDVWFVGMCLVSPVKVDSKSVAMLGSVVTKDMEYNHVYGGNPAKDLTSKLGYPWTNITIDEKVLKLKECIDIYIREVDPTLPEEKIVIVEDFPEYMDDRIFYNIKSRTYTKKNDEHEIKFNKWLFTYRAKFLPYVSNKKNDDI